MSWLSLKMDKILRIGLSIIEYYEHHWRTDIINNRIKQVMRARTLHWWYTNSTLPQCVLSSQYTTIVHTFHTTCIGTRICMTARVSSLNSKVNTISISGCWNIAIWTEFSFNNANTWQQKRVPNSYPNQMKVMLLNECLLLFGKDSYSFTLSLQFSENLYLCQW